MEIVNKRRFLVKRTLFLIASSCLISFSCSNASLEQLTKEQILDDFRSSAEYQAYKRSNNLYAQVITTFIIEPVGVKISTMNSGETRAFQRYINSQTKFKIKKVNYTPVNSFE